MVHRHECCRIQDFRAERVLLLMKKKIVRRMVEIYTDLLKMKEERLQGSSGLRKTLIRIFLFFLRVINDREKRSTYMEKTCTHTTYLDTHFSLLSLHDTLHIYIHVPCTKHTHGHRSLMGFCRFPQFDRGY